MNVYPDMHQAIRLHLDKSTSLTGSVDFLPEELDFWLNEAQDRFIKQRLYGNNYRQQKFDDTQKRIDDLKTLLVQSGRINLSPSYLAENVKECGLPTNFVDAPYLFYINSTLYNNIGNVLQTGDTISFDLISRYLKDSINNPYIRRPLVVFFQSGEVTVIGFIHGDEFIPTQCDITYIKKPRKLVSGTIGVGTYETNICELPEYTHKEIVIIAVELLIENIESQRVQTFSQINASKVE
jgi:hypothetical protein